MIINGFKDDDNSNRQPKISDVSNLSKVPLLLQGGPYVVPVISTSCKSGYWVPQIRHLMSELEPRSVWSTPLAGSVFYIDSKFTPPGIGLVVSGIMRGETIRVGDEMLIGPYSDGFRRVKVWSIHNNVKESISALGHQQRGCLAIRPLDGKMDVTKHNIRRGMVVTTGDNENCSCFQFRADIGKSYR